VQGEAILVEANILESENLPLGYVELARVEIAQEALSEADMGLFRMAIMSLEEAELIETSSRRAEPSVPPNIFSLIICPT
jgi:hypothetical protein